MKRIYLNQALKKKPILARLIDNVGGVVGALEIARANAEDVTLRQLRQLSDELLLETDKLRNRIIWVEKSMQPPAVRAKKR